MHADTRQRLLDIAEQLFAERGFYGVSIAAIASEVGLTKQGSLPGFHRNEKPCLHTSLPTDNAFGVLPPDSHLLRRAVRAKTGNDIIRLFVHDEHSIS